MSRLAVLLASAAVAFAGSVPPSLSSATQHIPDATGALRSGGEDRIGLTATQRQMIAWSIAGLADVQPIPPDFQARAGAKAPEQLKLSPMPNLVKGAPPAANYQYAMLNDKDLLLVDPQDGAIVDVIHLNRRL